MDACKTIFTHHLKGGTQLNKAGVMAFLSDVYDAFEMEQFEMVSFKSKGETIKDWWDLLDNAELLTWDLWSKNGQNIVSTLPCGKGAVVAEKDELSGKWKIVQQTTTTTTPATGNRRKTSMSLGLKQNEIKKEEAGPPVVTSASILENFSNYLEKVWEIILSFEEPTAATAEPWADRQEMLVEWINGIISAKGNSIDDLLDGFKDGLSLIVMLEVLSGVDLKGYVLQPTNFVEQYKNVCLALKFAAHLKIDSSGVTAEDFWKGKFEKILILLVKIAQKWPNYNGKPDSRKGKVSSQTAEFKLDQREQDEIYRLNTIYADEAKKAVETKAARAKARAAAKEKEEKEKRILKGAENVFVVDMGSLGKEQVPYQQSKLLKDILLALCKKHNIADINSYVATSTDGVELFLDSFLGELPMQIQFLPVQSEIKGTLADLINASDIKTQKRLQQVTIPARNYDEEDEDERESRKRQLERANAFDRQIDDSVSNLALEGLKKEYEKMMEALQLDKIREAQKAQPKSARAPSHISEIDAKYMTGLVRALDDFQGSFGRSETADKFFEGLW